MTSNQVLENCQLEKSHWKLNTLWPQNISFCPKNQQSIFIFHSFNAKLLGKYSQTLVWQLCDSCQILDLIDFQNNLSWPNSNTAGIGLDSRLKYSKITHRYAKNPHSLSSCTENIPLIQISSILSVNFNQSGGIDAIECFHWPVVPPQSMLGALIVSWPASFWLQWTMTEGTVHASSPAKFPTKSTEEWKKGKCML